MTDSALGTILGAMTKPGYADLEKLGVSLGKLYTDRGFPLDMALDKLDLPKDAKLAVINGACGWFIEHKRRSGATDKAVERARATNREILERFYLTGEVGIY